METRREKKRTILTIPRNPWINRKSKLANAKLKAKVKKSVHR